MANFNIAFDNNDVRLGKYFEKSKDDIVVYINANCVNPVVNEISSVRCNQAYIDLYIPTINQANFLFIAYSHGEVNSLTSAGNFYIHSPTNINLFINSFFYSMSCHTGKEMGLELIAKGGHSFIGYEDVAYALTGAYEQLSIECDNYCIKQFISGNNLEESFKLMKTNFTAQIDLLEQSGETLRASYLRRSRDALVLHGDGKLQFSSF